MRASAVQLDRGLGHAPALVVRGVQFVLGRLARSVVSYCAIQLERYCTAQRDASPLQVYEAFGIRPSDRRPHALRIQGEGIGRPER